MGVQLTLSDGQRCSIAANEAMRLVLGIVET
jgi:hypothetical protein